MRRLFRLRVALIVLPLVALVVIGAGTHRSAASTALCAFHGWRAYHDIRRAHPGWGAWQVYEASRACPK